MTLAEMLLFIAAGTGIYFLLRPLQRWIERRLIRKVRARQPRMDRRTIDVTDFTSYESHRREDLHR
jgi:hypothetical protein